MESKIHLIIAHPNVDSFNYALAEQVKIIAHQHAYQTNISDLYELARLKHPAINYYGLSANNNYDDEQLKFKTASLIILQFPIYWFSYPAVVQAYLEQIWQPGFAYPPTFEKSPLASPDKYVLFSVTTQSPESAYTDQGKNGDIKRILYPMMTAFRFVGCSILEPFISYAIAEQNEQQRNQILINYQKKLNTILTKPKAIMKP